MWTSNTLKRSLFQISNNNVAKIQTDVIRRSVSQQCSESFRHGNSRFAKTPEPSRRGFGSSSLHMDGVKTTPTSTAATTTKSSELFHGLRQDQELFKPNALGGNDSEHYTPAVAELMTKQMENSYYYASFKARGIHE